jgi:hypothetical protein
VVAAVVVANALSVEFKRFQYAALVSALIMARRTRRLCEITIPGFDTPPPRWWLYASCARTNRVRRWLSGTRGRDLVPRN